MFKSTTKKKLQGNLSSLQKEGNARLLIVDVIEARSILVYDAKKGTTDSYIRCSLLDLSDREIASETFHTQQKKGTVNPDFNQTFKFGNTYDLNTRNELPCVKFSLFHKGTFSVSETPLGEVVIPLADIDADGNAIDRWYPIKKVGRMEKVSGELHLKLQFSGKVEERKDVESGDIQDDDPDAEEMTPNELLVSVVQARSLLVMKTSMFSSAAGGSDPFVRVAVDNFPHQHTGYIKNTLAPVWNERFKFPHFLNQSSTLKLSVYDYNVTRKKFMGRVIVPLYDFFDKKSKMKWYKLLAKTENDGKDRGEIQVTIHWHFNAVVAEEIRKQAELDAKSAFKKMGGFIHQAANLVSGEVDDDAMDEAEDDGAAAVDPNQLAETPEQKEEKKKEEDQRKKELSDIDIKSGDYTIQVHIIEARDLKAENLDGTSDPVCFVEILGQKQNTRTEYSCTSCVYDEVLIFNFPKLEKEQFQDDRVLISVKDATINPFAKKKMIGSATYDLMAIYTGNKDHEIYRSWIALMDDEEADDIGVQGYLKVSISIIGPGEKMKVHNEDEEIAKEIANETKAGMDVGSLVLSVPTIRKEWKFLVMSLYRAETLTVMDSKVGIGGVSLSSAGTDAYVKLQVGGAKPLKTKAVTVKGDNRLAINPIFNYELWFPVSIPSTTQIIKITVLDKDELGDEAIGLFYEKLGDILRTPNSSLDAKWYNIYGKPEFKNDSFARKAVELAKKSEQAAKSRLTFDNATDYNELYNNVPDKGSTFKGRVLCKFRVATKRPTKFDTVEVKPFIQKISKNVRSPIPPSQAYVLKALVVVGNMLPNFRDLSATKVLTSGITFQDLRVKVTIGAVELTTRPAKDEDGMCRWNELLRSDPIQFPQDYRQIPDIIIYLVNKANKPVCFRRIKPVAVNKDGDVEFLGFGRDAEWVILQEDKVINAIDDDEFPGSLLIKLGFGPKEEAEQSSQEWTDAIKNAKNMGNFQVRVQLYQGKNLPALDSNGLSDPFVKIDFVGQKRTSEYKTKTRFPEYYQTFVFNDLKIPEADDFRYCPPVNFHVYDKDLFGGSDYMGMCSFYLSEGFKSSDPNAPLPDPKWISLYKEVPGDSQGELLVNVQIIPLSEDKNAERDKLMKPPNSIQPDMKDAFIEIIAIGIRDMKPYLFQPMVSPFLELELNSTGASYLAATEPTRRPMPNNPNFLEKILIPCKIPWKSIYATPLQLRSKDVRLGGFSKPVVGVGAVDVTTKIPWCEDTYIPPQSDIFAKDINKPIEGGEFDGLEASNLDSVSIETAKLQARRQRQLAEDGLIAMQEPLPIEHLLKERVKAEDNGAGVFGAMTHITLDGKKKTKKAENAFSDPDWSQDDVDKPPAWAVNRKVLDSELEDLLKTTPFETYDLTRGKAGALIPGQGLKVVGKFKGLVRVIEDPATAVPFFEESVLENLLNPKGYKIRLYVLKGRGFPSDKDMFGKSTPSDPYLRVTLGKQVFNDRNNAVENDVEVDFYKLITFDAELPGASQMVIQVLDKNDFRPDKLIGQTIIDLEDRWFDARWQKQGEENQVNPDSGDVLIKPRWQTKPIERRTLYNPTSRGQQGMVECWVDIMTPETALVFEPDDVSLPPKQIFEVRVVIWKSKNVPAMDKFSGMSDLFLKVWPEGCKAQETDTHWRCKRGKASWNYRLNFDVELGHSTKAMKFPYLHLQLWDRGLLMNDCAGEVTVDLRKYYRKAYKRGVALKLFETKKGGAAKRAAKKGKEETKSTEIFDDHADIPPEEKEEEAINEGQEVRIDEDGDSDDDDEDADSDDDDDIGLGVPPKQQAELSRRGATTQIAGTGNVKVVNPHEAAKAQPQQVPWYAFWRSKKVPPKPTGEGKENEEKEPLLGEPQVDEEAKTDEQKKKEEDDDEVNQFVTMIKSLTGLWEDDPEDSSWAHFEQHDHNTGKMTPMGSVAYSVQIWPKDKAQIFAVGTARSEPNTNPFLPPPVGRLKFSLNPFVMGSALCGPKICTIIFCCLLAGVFTVLMIFAQPFLNLVINIIFFCCCS